MPKPLDDLSQDPFEPKPNTDDQHTVDSLRDVAVDRTKRAASNYVRTAPKRIGRRLFWSIVLSFGLSNEWERDRMVDRLEDGQSVGCYRMFFGEQFSLFGMIRMLIFFGVIAFVIYYLWANGFIQQLLEQQALIENLQSTSTP
ncbi:MAG: hypothetical protein ACFE0Q_21280 [Anaerolineae bacterium]